MSLENDFKFVRLEEYWGSAEEVQKKMKFCKVCGTKLLVSHIPDQKNLVVQETIRCIECGGSNTKTLHGIN